MAARQHGIWKISDGVLRLEVDVKDLDACKAAAFQLHLSISAYYGVAAANEIMNGSRRGKRDLKDQKNFEY
jgi:hypothetical protein